MKDRTFVPLLFERDTKESFRAKLKIFTRGRPRKYSRLWNIGIDRGVRLRSIAEGDGSFAE